MERVTAYPHDSPWRGVSCPGLRANPLDQIAEEHKEQRVMCSDLENLVDCTRPAQAPTIALLTYLTKVWPRHIADEKGALSRLLRRRAAPADDIHDTLSQLMADHAESDRVLDRVVQALRRVLCSNTGFTDGEVADAVAFATHERRSPDRGKRNRSSLGARFVDHAGLEYSTPAHGPPAQWPER